MSEDALELVRLRNNFYRDNYRRVLGAVLFLIVIAILLVAAIFYLIINRPEPKYYATTSDGRVLPIYSLSQPVISRAALLQWANQAAIAVYDYGFHNYPKQLQVASDYFTPQGWKEFQAELTRTGNLNTVISNKIVVSAVATGAPVILEQGILFGRYSWKVQIPLKVTYQGTSGSSRSQSVIVNMLVQRVSTLEYQNGIAVANFVVSNQGKD